MFSAIELLFLLITPIPRIYLFCCCARTAGVWEFMVIYLRSPHAPWGAKSFPVRYHGKGWGWNTSPQHATASKTWIQAALGAPQKSLSHTVLRGRGGNKDQGREGTSLNVRDGRKEGARLGSLPSPSVRQPQ